MPKLTNKGLLAVAIILSFATSMLVYSYLQKASESNKTGVGVSVVVAKADIPPRTKITQQMVEEIKVPAEYLQPGVVQDLKGVIGIVARERIFAGEQLTERRLVREGRSVGFTGIIPRDKRAVTVPVNEVSGVAGFVKPGDYVDVIVTFEQSMAGDNVSSLLLQNILVLAANREAEEGLNAPAKEGAKDAIKTATVTLAVTPDEAARLTLAHEKGKVNLALRPYLPLNGFEITNAFTPKDLVGVHASPVKPQPDTRTPPPQYPPVYVTSEPQQKAAAPAEVRGVQVIRGTKAETIPFN